MKVLCDEGVEKQVVAALRRSGHEVTYIAELEPGITDPKVLHIATYESALLITNDKDFGELVYRQGKAASGVVLLRMFGLSTELKVASVVAAFDSYRDQMIGGFTVISPGRVRLPPRA